MKELIVSSSIIAMIIFIIYIVDKSKHKDKTPFHDRLK